eukprot:TRINITY_DN29939_c0_g1_i1.p1 TRINITY_DN29939_c0_g1~~TRINITY_DN29939_c0_g1_i1.p1  ORF type:complete len:340 (+),score=104.16 TRINITY_DN29939_c0_g1_i1:103-1122(+)
MAARTGKQERGGDSRKLVQRSPRMLATLLCAALAVDVTAATSLRRSRDVPLPAVTSRIDGEMALSKSAVEEADLTSKEVLTAQREMIANMGQLQAEQEAEAGAAVLPQAKAALTEARSWAFVAQKHADHIREVAFEIKQLPKMAAENAVEVVQDKIVQAAHRAAVESVKKPETPEERANKVADAVAEAIEPVHLNLLRAQKAADESYNKAKEAAVSVDVLKAEAQAMAVQAQKMQASGASVKAQMLMTQAHAKLAQAQNAKLWAEKLYGQANDINQDLGRWQVRMAQVAQAAADSANAPAADPLQLPLMPFPGVEFQEGDFATFAGGAPAPAPAPAPAR